MDSAKVTITFLALSFWVLAHTASSAEDHDPNALNQQVHHLIEQGKYQEALPIAEKAVEVAKRARGPEHLDTADALNNLGLLFKKSGDYASKLDQAMGEYAKAEPLLLEALQIRQKALGPEHPDTARSLDDLGELYRPAVW